VTAKALDFALAVVGHELGAVERQQGQGDVGGGFRKTSLSLRGHQAFVSRPLTGRSGDDPSDQQEHLDRAYDSVIWLIL
jgi:hypothetical protein